MLTHEEEWRPIPGFNGLYEASSLGRVRSWHTHRGVPGPRILRRANNKDGYFRMALNRNGKGYNRHLHAWIALAFLGPRPEGLEVRHLDGDQTNNRVSNLAYGTHSENVQDTIRHGRHYTASKTRCHRGHEYDRARVQKDGTRRRVCRTCQRESELRYKQRRRANASASTVAA